MAMQKLYIKILVVFILFIIKPRFAWSDFPQYSNNPFSFPVAEPIDGWGSNILVVDLNGDGLLDFSFLSPTKLYAYDHYGSKLWDAFVNNQGHNHGTKHGAADIDGDGNVEIVVIINANQVAIYNGPDGALENTIDVSVGTNQVLAHVAVVNFRGEGDRDSLIQTMDQSAEGPHYYINRTLIAMRMDTRSEMWRVEQDNDTGNGYYEGYWGMGHGSFQCADVDEDGKDEVVGGNMIDDDGTVINLGYPAWWVDLHYSGYMDHFDAISIGDFRPDLPGLEWILTEEDGSGQSEYNTVLMSRNGVIWSRETSLFTQELEREPQNVAVGNFDPGRSFIEIWNRSRFGGDVSQHPWIFDINGNQFSDYDMLSTLPAGFNTHPDYGNREGVEVIWTIDWAGTKKEYIAAKARHVDGNVGVFDAVTGQEIWSTVDVNPQVRASAIYVADIAGDGREEIVLYDENDGRIKVYWNPEPNTNQPKPNKWDAPLYRRLKQNWNYYSPGGYSYSQYPLISDITVNDITPGSAGISWQTDVESDTRIQYGETSEYGSQTNLDVNLTTSHTVQLTDLEPNTVYHFRVESRNAYGQLGFSADSDELVTLELATPAVVQATDHNFKNLQLTWTSSPGVIEYNVYRDIYPYFNPDQMGGTNRIGTFVIDQDIMQPDIQWMDESEIVGDWQTNFFYLVTATSGIHESNPTEPVGEFDYPLITTPTTDFNEIALPLNMPDISTAADLMAMIPGCNSVARWNAGQQGYDQFIPGIPPTNFAVEMGYPYYVNVVADTIFSSQGEITTPSFHLITTPTTDFNEIMLTLDMTHITRASELMADIPNCNSIARWNADIQGYEQYIPGIPPTDFDVRIGYPYYVNVTSDVTWPEGTPISKKMDSNRSRQTDRPSLAPHCVWGRIHLEMEGGRKQNNMRFTAYITSRTQEKLTEQSSGCRIEQGYWIVQCRSFSSPWKAGDILHIHFEDKDGGYSQKIEIPLTYAPVDEVEKIVFKEDMQASVHLELKQNAPNPFNPLTMIRYQLGEPSRVRLTVYNLLGQVVRRLLDTEQEQGYHTILWDGRNDRGQPMGTGIYFCSLETDKQVFTQKLSLIR